MSNHYYSEKPTVESSRRKWESHLRGLKMLFTSDAGVFSKKEVDFGSQLLLETFRFPRIDGDILDVGCGYGPIGLTLAKENPNCNLTLVDVNERALELTELNAKLNQVKNVTIKKSNLLSAIEGKKFASILSNPPIRAGKKVVHQLFEEAYSHLIDDGELWIVIQKKQGAPSAIEKLESLFSDVVVEKKSKGYFIISAKRS
ncbi:class I SAM-dependent methyltransferase [Anaerobacillus isosaccharinicus]|uniref:16S rRNA methyltransferase n=1 Tax=Anaerobacillus isosaccharinicus TaxID=1532552 RepID=A0A1S2MF46_9BACI|nr:class I SAM-dependent methyltransferase [Anaerobacillus isosaccharinicus]MBA5584068.1 class I SAM-dependent methyltransferase [Anaerobacillus isosaccharinicus]QOY37520.1 class I SAM-dependent methyltransferase [Anaerobacillus isosaccharinicus]